MCVSCKWNIHHLSTQNLIPEDAEDSSYISFNTKVIIVCGLSMAPNPHGSCPSFFHLVRKL